MSTGGAASTVEALAFQVRKGPATLREETARRRIGELSEPQAKEIAARLTKERWSYDGKSRVPPWPAEAIASFIALWETSHG